MATIVETFVGTATSLLTALPRTMQVQRSEALEAVLELGSALQRSIDLTVLYLKGVDSIDSEGELDAYLSNARTKLRESSDEFKICKGIYALRGKLNSWFSSGRLAISRDAQHLVTILIHGERSVIDEITHAVPFGMSGHSEQEVRASVRRAIIELQEQSDGIKRAVRQFVDSM